MPMEIVMVIVERCATDDAGIGFTLITMFSATESNMPLR